MAAASPAERPDPLSLGLSDEEITAQVARGEYLYRSQDCRSCHSVNGSWRREAPTWKGIYNQSVTLNDGTIVMRDYRYLRRAIRHPHEQIVSGYYASMSAYPQLSADDVDALLWYIWSLRDVETDAAEPAATAPATPPNPTP